MNKRKQLQTIKEIQSAKRIKGIRTCISPERSHSTSIEMVARVGLREAAGDRKSKEQLRESCEKKVGL
jgi:hypothetical protein